MLNVLWWNNTLHTNSDSKFILHRKLNFRNESRKIWFTFKMCFPLLGCLVDVLPYICVVTVPVYGSFCGIDLILRVSLLFYAYSFVTHFGPNFLVRLINLNFWNALATSVFKIHLSLSNQHSPYSLWFTKWCVTLSQFQIGTHCEKRGS